MLEVNGKEDDQRRPEQQPADEEPSRRCEPDDEHGDQRGQRFDNWVLWRNRGTAIGTPSTERQPACQRNVVKPAQRLAALRAPRGRPRQRFASWQTVDAYVEKAAHAEAERSGEQQ